MNKKIAVLTFHKPINYGAFLQAFSLSSYLQARYPNAEVEIVDYVAPIEQAKVYKNVLRALKYSGVKAFFSEICKISVFAKSAKKYLKLSENVSTPDLNKLYRFMNDNYDAIIVGSDAILNWTQNGYPSAFYLNYPFTIPIFTYAASAHGMDFLEITDEQKKYVSDSFARFELLGVRDTNTERFVEEYNKDSEYMHTCDPTVFIDLDRCKEYAQGTKNRLLKKYRLDISKPYIVLMLLDDEISSKVKERYGKDYTIVTLFKHNKYADMFLYDLHPFEWVEVLAKSSLTVTQYFHGALLSLRNLKSVVVIDKAGNTDKFESKLHDLMCKRFDAPELYLTAAAAKADENKLFAACELGRADACRDKIKKMLASERESMERYMTRLDEYLPSKEFEL